MRLSNVAVYTLAALAAGALSAEANPSQSKHSPPVEQAIALSSTLQEAVATPETLVAEIESDRTEVIGHVEAFPEKVQPTNNLVAELSTTNTEKLGSTELLLTEGPGAEALLGNNFVSESSITADLNQQVTPPTQNRTTTCGQQTRQSPQSAQSTQVAQRTARDCPRPDRITPLAIPEVEDEFESSPGLSIYIPVGFGADRNTVFIGGTYQNTTRHNDDDNNGNVGVGIGLGDADRLVGVELSYAFKNFNDENDFGEGGFNAKVHRRFGNSLSIAAGYNGFVNIGRNDFEHSRYGVITKIFRTQESIRSPLSRVAVTLGVGDGQFRSNGAIDAGDNDANFFGNIALRIIRPVSLITEWTGTDLALGLSIAPFKRFPWVITPAVRDLAGRGDDPRFVLGSGISFQF